MIDFYIGFIIGTPKMESAPTRKELIQQLDDMIQRISDLPNQAMISPVTYYDHASLLILLSAIFRSE